MNQTSDAWETKYRRSRMLNVVLGALAVFLGVVVAAQLLPGQSPTATFLGSSDTGSGQSSADEGELMFVRRDANDPMAIGDVDAPVVLTEWVDMRCPFCAVFSRDTLPILIDEYVETGKVRIEFHDVVFYGEQSQNAAIAARAAGRQDMYVEYLTAMHEVAPEGGHADLPRETLIGFAEEIDIPDLDQFIADLDDPELREDVVASTRSSQELGVTAVPFFVAGNMAVSGAQPVDVFRDFLDQALVEVE